MSRDDHHGTNVTTGSRLPPETLSPIFRILSLTYPPFSKWMKSTRRKFLGWIYVTHVCQFWRNVAIGDRALWTDISSELSGPWITEALRRSSGLPITLSLISAEHSINPAIFVETAFAPAELLRLTRLHLCTKITLNMMRAVKQLGQHAPLLEQLTIQVQYATEICALPDTMTASTLPRLRKLVLRGWVPASWDASYLRNLTTLELDAPDCRQEMRMTVIKCMELLSRSPRVESIVLSGVMHPIWPGDEILFSIERDDDRCLVLNHLKKITIRATNDNEILVLLSQLKLPVVERVQAEYGSVILPVPGPRPLFPLLTRHIWSRSNPAGRTIKKLSIASWSRSKYRAFLVAWDDAWSDDTRDAMMSATWPHEARPWPGLLREVSEVLHLADVTVLKMVINRQQPAALEIFLRSMPAVKKLTVSGVNDTPMVALLTRNESIEGDEGHGHAMLFPQLEDLTMIRTSVNGDSADTMQRNLLAMLRARRISGSGIKMLTLRRLPGDDRSVVDALKEWVDELVLTCMPRGLYEM